MDQQLSTEEQEYQPLSGVTAEQGISTSISRRRFFKVLGSGLAVVLVFQDAFSLAPAGKKLAVAEQIPTSQVGAWLHIGSEGTVTVFTGKVEVGQNIRTSLAQVVAEELQVPLAAIKMVMGDTDLVPFDAGTFGSRSTPAMGMQLKKAAASAREILLDLAARELKVDKSTLKVADGKVLHPSTKKVLPFGKITQGKNILLAVSDQVALTPADQWQVAGKSLPKVNGRDILTGRHQFVSDMKLPGMLYGKILRGPATGATITAMDLTAAQAIPGVRVVREGDFVGVAAPDPATASKALALLKAEWKQADLPSRAQIFQYFKDHATEEQSRGGNAPDTSGQPAAGGKQAGKTLHATYQVDYIAHAPMEPRAALARWENGKLTVWTGTQRPFGVQADLAGAFNLERDQVRVIMPDTGSAYGGKHSGEAALEAARLAKVVGKPVKLTWTREEEFKWAYFRPAGLIEVSSGVKDDGTLTSWELHNYNSGPSGIRTPYTVADAQSIFHPVKSPLKQGSYRGLASTANIFVIESHMDDLARLVNQDPLTFRLKNLEEPRLRAVFEAAAKGFGWGQRQPAPDHGFGIGGGTEKGGFTATCAEIVVNPQTGEVKVIRTVTAFECGAVVNPAHLDNQIMGAVVQGLGGALFEAIDFENGRILNPKFSQYRVPRFKDTPQIEIIQLNRKDLPSAGAGEAPIVGVAPAIRNAIAHATGIRLKTLPLAPNGLELNVKN
jgi:nicotinate dehydrogenase subunit B